VGSARLRRDGGEAMSAPRSPHVILGRGRSPSCPGPIVRRLPNLGQRSSTVSAGTEACGAPRRLDPGHKARDDNVVGGHAMNAPTHAHVLHKAAHLPTRVAVRTSGASERRQTCAKGSGPGRLGRNLVSHGAQVGAQGVHGRVKGI
jgi:hypothetical protein